jgi:hypothetical protein
MEAASAPESADRTRLISSGSITPAAQPVLSPERRAENDQAAAYLVTDTLRRLSTRS